MRERGSKRARKTGVSTRRAESCPLPCCSLSPLPATSYWLRSTIHGSWSTTQGSRPTVQRPPFTVFPVPCSLGPCRGPGDRPSSLGWLGPCFFTPPPMPSAPTPPVFLPTPAPCLFRFLLFCSVSPSVPKSRSPCFYPPPHTFRTPPPMPVCETVKL